MPVTLETMGTVREARGVGFNDVHLVVADGELHVQDALHLEVLGDLGGVFLNGADVLGGDGHGRNGAGGVSGVDAGQLNVLHDRGHEGVRAVGQRVHFRFNGIVQEAVDQHGIFRADLNGFHAIALQVFFIVNDFHAAAPSTKEGRTITG